MSVPTPNIMPKKSVNAAALAAATSAPDTATTVRQGTNNAAYKYRGLQMMGPVFYAVSGRDNRSGGMGVLEWCVDALDAEERLEIMSEYTQFTDLVIFESED